MPDQQPNQTLKHVIVAVRNIGDQTELAALRRTAAQSYLFQKANFAVSLDRFHRRRETCVFFEPVFGWQRCFQTVVTQQRLHALVASANRRQS